MYRESTEYSAVRESEASRDNRALKTLLLGSIVFVTLGVSIANVTLSRFGMEDNYVMLFSAAFVFAILILSRNIFMIGLVLLGVFAINLPETTLLAYSLDRDFLLAFVCAMILLPNVYSMLFK